MHEEVGKKKKNMLENITFYQHRDAFGVSFYESKSGSTFESIINGQVKGWKKGLQE